MNYLIYPIDRCYPIPGYPSFPYVELYRDVPDNDDLKVHRDDGDLNHRDKEDQLLFRLE
jgi:hypothetical protein